MDKTRKTSRALAEHVSNQMLSRYAYMCAKRAAIQSLEPAAGGSNSEAGSPQNLFTLRVNRSRWLSGPARVSISLASLSSQLHTDQPRDKNREIELACDTLSQGSIACLQRHRRDIPVTDGGEGDKAEIA